MNKTPPPADFDENPERTEETSARAQQASAVLPPHAATALVKNKGGRPRGSSKEQVALRLDKDLVTALRASGLGWQTRVNDILRRAVLESAG